MPSSIIFMIISIALIVAVFVGGGFFCYSQYQLYKLTKFSEMWRPWKGSLIGLICLEAGIVFAVGNLFYGLFLTFPDLLIVKFMK
ncbi:MAG: hypothetical protein ACTSO9_05370 [Candidatus Helarchaeota archaeon]